MKHALPAGPSGAPTARELKRQIAELQEKLSDAKHRRTMGYQLQQAATTHADKQRETAMDQPAGASDPVSAAHENEDPLNPEASFHLAPLRGRSIKSIAKQQPGTLHKSGLEEMSRFILARGGAQSSEEAAVLAGRVVPYLVSVFHGRHPPDKVGTRTCQEMRLCAECLDALAEGNLCAVGDFLMQHFKALENFVSDGHWGIASQLELTTQNVGLTTLDERERAARQQALELRVKETATKAAPKGPS